MKKRDFNQSYYNESKHSEKRIISQLKDFFEIKNNGNSYGADLEIFDKCGKFIANADIEVRFKWKQKYFPFYSVHIPIRKKKFINSNIPFFYFVVNADGTDCMVTSSKHILNSKIITLKLKYPDKEIEEEFFDVPLVKFKQGFSQLVGYLTNRINESILESKQSTIEDYEFGGRNCI